MTDETQNQRDNKMTDEEIARERKNTLEGGAAFGLGSMISSCTFGTMAVCVLLASLDADEYHTRKRWKSVAEFVKEERGRQGKLCEQLEAQYDTDGNGKLDSKESERMARATGYGGAWPDGAVARVVPGTTYLNEAVLGIRKKGEAISPEYTAKHNFPASKLKNLVRKTQNRR
jgi:hypothetical protein